MKLAVALPLIKVVSLPKGRMVNGAHMISKSAEWGKVRVKTLRPCRWRESRRCSQWQVGKTPQDVEDFRARTIGAYPAFQILGYTWYRGPRLMYLSVSHDTRCGRKTTDHQHRKACPSHISRALREFGPHLGTRGDIPLKMAVCLL